ncbi:hypothetical protein SLA2020_186910 [Shorea laevis]
MSWIQKGGGTSALHDEEPESVETLSGDGVCVEIKKIGRNFRKIRSKIGIDAGLDTVWNIMTDYEKLVDIVPGLVVSKLVEKKGNSARLYQIGQQNLPLGLKFNAKVVLDCYEKDLEISPFGKKRDIEFKMVEGDFQCFEGKWSIEQFNGGQCKDSEASFGQNFQTSLSYVVDVKPKLWLPVHLIEGRICREIKTNLTSIREEAKKVFGEGKGSIIAPLLNPVIIGQNTGGAGELIKLRLTKDQLG